MANKQRRPAALIAFIWLFLACDCGGGAEQGETPPLTVRFLDVGQADAAILTSGGHAMLIDGGNVADSSLVYTALKDLGIDSLDYIVATHPHEDHVGGLAGALSYATAKVAFCSVTSYDSKAFANFLKALEKQGLSITVPAAGETFTLGLASCVVLGPVKTFEDDNDNSLVIKVSYGNVSFLFMGDAQREEEASLLEAYSEEALSATVLKEGHHGGASSSTYPFLRASMPAYAVISVGAGNPYGHPDEGTLSRLKDAGVAVYRTDELGDVIANVRGGEVAFSFEKR